jgi:hypothetical protein
MSTNDLSKAKSGKKTRKHGRSLRKANAKSKPLSKYVRGKISFEQYYKESGSKR